TSNIAKSVNAMFDVERELFIVALFDEINRRFALLFHQRLMKLVHSANRFVPSLKKTYQSMLMRATSYWPIKLLTTSSASLVMEMLLLWIYKEEVVLVEFLIWTKYLVHMPWQRFDPNMVLILEI
ncbi:hypothetical protein EJD97_000336, partial [Solanum chilense]